MVVSQQIIESPSSVLQRLSQEPDLPFDERIGKATARRTYLRKIAEIATSSNTEPIYESRSDLAERVATGNSLIYTTSDEERELLYHAIRTGKLLTAGRHLQHGDASQPERVMELFTNCSTSPFTSALFLLLLNGSGVGRSYDDDYIYTDWRHQPELILVLDENHPDWGRDVMGCSWEAANHGVKFQKPEDGVREMHRQIREEGKRGRYIKVPDSREGWAKALEVLENATYERTIIAEGRNGVSPFDVLVFDFSNVRPEGTPIGGMQDRPASGPVPLMYAMREVSRMRTSHDFKDWEPWKTTLAVDHELASVVAVGGARRAARMATKRWDDPGIFEFIEFKRENKTKDNKVIYNSSNNSVLVSETFWKYVEWFFGPAGLYEAENCINRVENDWGSWATGYNKISVCDKAIARFGDKAEIATHAANVFLAVTFCSYFDSTGEPAFINGDQIDRNTDGIDILIEAIDNNRIEDIIGHGTPDGYKLSSTSAEMFKRVLRAALSSPFPMIVNPCGEVALSVWGAYCVIADIGLGNWVKNYTRVGERSLTEIEEEITAIARATTRFLMRVNLMPCLWKGEVRRTNRIGVGLTGIHEFALGQFGLNFYELIDDEVPANYFWSLIARVSQAVHDEAQIYAAELGVVAPHTDTTIKPSGTISKLDNLTEGCHLPAKLRYLRNVQFQTGDGLVASYHSQGYPVAELTSGEYKGVHVVGFPTKPFIVDLAERLELDDELVTAPEARPEEQYRWLELLEEHWITGGQQHMGNQVSYTLKYDASKTSYQHFVNMMLKHQPRIRCCSVMPEFPLAAMPNPYPEVDEYIVEYDGPEAAKRTKETPFEYVPEQILSAEVFNAIEQQIYRAQDLIEDIGYEHLDCGTGGCPIEFQTTI